MRRIFSVFIPPRSNRAFPVPNHHHYGPGRTRSSLGNNAGTVLCMGFWITWWSSSITQCILTVYQTPRRSCNAIMTVCLLENDLHGCKVTEYYLNPSKNLVFSWYLSLRLIQYPPVWKLVELRPWTAKLVELDPYGGYPRWGWTSEEMWFWRYFSDKSDISW